MVELAKAAGTMTHAAMRTRTGQSFTELVPLLFAAYFKHLIGQISGASESLCFL